MANSFEDNLWLATFKLRRANLERFGPGQPTAHLAVLATANELAKLDLDASPSAAEDSGPGQPINNNNNDDDDGDLGTDDPQVSDETHAQDLRDLEEMLAGVEEEFVAEGGRDVEMGEGDGGEAVGRGDEGGGGRGGGEDWSFGEPAEGEGEEMREQGGLERRKSSSRAPGYSRRMWESMEPWERHRAWRADAKKRKQKKRLARWGVGAAEK